ncbi:hypothetical protein TrLO_g361 [Triparma laevis f. longispina]|uniref:Uncharacterized protein n=1 Tax=Triparma laevis f. longispina TaxID=1714387 RepID=A0A9W7F964_9STRA|nr:hypothetical protein TrLO_g361 [Triparma laevis f. longispina]
MSKSVASESKDDHETPKTSSKRGRKDERNEEEEGIIDLPPEDNSTTLTAVSDTPTAIDQFMHTPGLKRHFVEFVHVQTLITLRCTTKAWKAVAEEVIDEGVRSRELMVHGGKDLYEEVAEAREERCKLARQGRRSSF